ncbi:MAG: large conductance mechanosensitive channel protein MscL [Bacteroidota bacterium]|nr:large conductance mechanosensitive channel protein MscL [Bacteroidota bacterium]
MFKEFKNFAIRGNLIDIAVGLVMATYFGLIVQAFVDGIFMPLVGMFFEVGDLAEAKFVLSPEIIGPDGKVITSESAIKYGQFMTTILNFIIIAWVMFMIVKTFNKIKLLPVEAPAPAGPTTEQLLAEIRDLLKK